MLVCELILRAKKQFFVKRTIKSGKKNLKSGDVLSLYEEIT